MTTELADNATTEEINQYVDAIVEDRKGTTDAEKLARDNDETILAEQQSGKSDAAPKGDEAEKPAPPDKDWLDDNLRSEVAAYGIDETELADFTSREEVERALRFFDRSALEAGRKAMAEDAPPDKADKTRDEQGRFVKKEEPAKEPPTEGRYQVGLDKDMYEESLIEEFGKLSDHYESRLSSMESRFAEMEARAEEQAFDGYVDALGHGDLFGTTGKESAKHLERRQDLLVAVKAHQIGLRALGRPTDMDQSLVHRVARMVFAEELGKKEWKEKTRKVTKQSASRMGGGASKPTEPPETLMAEMERLYKELEGA